MACLTAHGEMTDVKIGDRDIEIHMMPWYSGFVSTSAAFLTGKVVETNSKVSSSPQQTWLSESCVVRVDQAFGQLEELEGIRMAILKAGYPSPLSEPEDPNWGTLRHLQKDQRILVLVEEYENAPSFGFEVIRLTPELETLPSILRRTKCDPTGFTISDLSVVKRASQTFYDQLVTEAQIRREIRQGDLAFTNRLVLTVTSGFLAMLLVVDFIRRK